MAQLTRPVVTMDLANRSIGRAGLLANRVMHPLVASRFGREVGTLAQISDVKVTPSLTGITVQGMECGKNHIILPLYAKFLLRSGVSEIALPKGTAEDRISDIFRTVTTRTPVKAERLLKDVSVEMANKGNKQEENRITWRELYNVAYQPRKVQPELYLGCGSLFIGPAYGGFSGIMSGIGYSNSLVSLASLTALGIISGFVIPAIAPPIAYRIYNIGIDISYILSRTKQVVGLGSINTVLLSHHSQNLVKAISPLDAREKIAKDPKTPVAVLMILASDHTPIFPRRFYDDIPAVAFDNINKKGLTADQLSILAESGSDEVRTKVAQHPNTPVDTLMKLGVRGSNAAFDHLNEKGLTPEQLVMLADSSSSNIREKVAQHPNTSVDALMKLALQDSIVAFDRLNEKGLSAEQLAVLADSQSSEVREKAAQHPNTSFDTLTQMVSQGNYINDVFNNLYKRELTPEQFAMFADSQSSKVREKVAQHPAIPVRLAANIVNRCVDYRTNYSVDVKGVYEDQVVGYEVLGEDGLFCDHVSVGEVVPIIKTVTIVPEEGQYRTVEYYVVDRALLILRAHESAKQEQILDEIAKTDPDWAHRLRSNLGAETNNS